MGIDVQSDRVIDRLMAERQRSQDIAAQAEGKKIVEQVDETAAVVETKTSKPARRSDIMQIINEKGEVSVDDIQKLIAKNVRRGV